MGKIPKNITYGFVHQPRARLCQQILEWITWQRTLMYFLGVFKIEKKKKNYVRTNCKAQLVSLENECYINRVLLLLLSSSSLLLLLLLLLLLFLFIIIIIIIII